jgi:hypothetical protein
MSETGPGKAFPEVAEMLARAWAAGLRTAILSNGTPLMAPVASLAHHSAAM